MRPDRTFTIKTRMSASVLLCALVVSTCLAQQQSGGLVDPPWLKEFAHKRIVYTVPGMTLDDATLNSGIDRFVQLALAKNLTLEVVNHATGQHGFDIADDNDRSREIIKRTIEFIKANS